MPYRLLFATLFIFAAGGLSGRADTIFRKGEKPVLGEVTSEDASGVTVVVKKMKEKIPGVDVLDVHYDGVNPATLRIGAYKAAKEKEKEANDSPDAFKRKAALALAIAQYGETLKSMSPPHQYATRTIRYKIAILLLGQAQIEKLSPDKAIAELQRYRTDFPDSWQINHVMPLIAQTQLDAGDFKGAGTTFEDMAAMATLPADVRTNAELMVVQVAVRAGNIAAAEKKLAALEAKAIGNPKLILRVKMTKAEVLIGSTKIAEAEKLLHQVVKESTDKDIKALAHNTLGECLFKLNRYNEGLWEFIWVDTVFNQDRGQHAKALYYLWKTFDQLSKAERAQECREMLLSPQFVGTEWQRKALKETAK